MSRTKGTADVVAEFGDRIKESGRGGANALTFLLGRPLLDGTKITVSAKELLRTYQLRRDHWFESKDMPVPEGYDEVLAALASAGDREVTLYIFSDETGGAMVFQLQDTVLGGFMVPVGILRTAAGNE